ncbi:facilitated trehalose transporter Tret1-like isoform X2 [Anthonomus grandis grandis]|uniref:facilitated trehalose transporter Tret1-like isoform X2 n=1 Tax=Anthonomus grandis grandis TaxID=2921223 RepID=UPI00216661D6|nr:facilitated trehalose transporter Tret1-like isoform X2 [Anthonomus grandis grandis]
MAGGASCLSLFKPAKKNCNDAVEEKHKNTKDDGLREMIASCKSLSQYEGKTFKSLLPQILASLLAASFHIGNGISLAYSAVLISQLEQPDSPFKPTKTQNSWMASVLIVIIPPASIFSGIIMDNLGRLNCIKIAGLPGVAGWSLIALANDVPTIIAGRLLVGISSAWGTSPGIVYITEIANSNLRMSLMAIAPAYVSLGMVLTYMLGWYLHWRTLAWICNVFIIVPCLVCIIIHESPSWLILKGKYDQAKKSLNWIHKYQKKPGEQETYADLQYKILQEEQEKKKIELAKQKSQKGIRFIMQEFLKPTGWKPLLILTGLFFFQHFSGIYITMFYSISFIQEAGSSIDGYLASIMIGIVRLIMSVASIYILKGFRRRSLIFISCSLMASCMFVAGLWTRWIQEGSTEMRWVPVAALLFYVVASTLGLLPIPNMMIAELFPLEIRGIGYSVSYSLCCVLMFVALQSYYNMNELFNGSSNLQWFFGIVCLGGAVYSYIFLPETFKLKLEDITEYFKTRFVYIGHNRKKLTKDEADEKMLKENNVNNNENLHETV